MNTLYFAATVCFLIGLSIAVPITLSLRPRWKARGYALGYNTAYSTQQRLLDANAERISALHADLAQLTHMREIEKRGHQTSLEAVMNDCDERIAVYARRAVTTHQDVISLQHIAKQLEHAASSYSHLGATEGARMAHQAQLEALNLAERIRAALEHHPEQTAKAGQEKAA